MQVSITSIPQNLAAATPPVPTRLDLPAAEHFPPDRLPVAGYLAALSPSSRRSPPL